MTDTSTAYSICEGVLADESTSGYAKTYAQAALDQRMTGETLDVQMNYVAANVGNEFTQRIAEWQGIASTSGFQMGYCQICGDRDHSNAYHGQTEAASGLVCVSCFDDFGTPDSCDKCGTTTYEGDKMISGPHEGSFFCNSCLQTI